MGSLIKVALVEDQQLLIDGVAALLNGQEDISFIGHVATMEHLRKMAQEEQPDIFILNVHVKGLDAIESIKMIKRNSPETKILMLGLCTDETVVFEGIQAGAEAFLLTNVSNEELISTIHHLYRGGTALSGKAARWIIDRIKELNLNSKDYLHHCLQKYGFHFTNREIDIAYLLMKGHSNREISDKLGIEKGTVKNYISEIYSKLNIHRRSEVVEFLTSIVEGTIDY